MFKASSSKSDDYFAQARQLNADAKELDAKGRHGDAAAARDLAERNATVGSNLRNAGK